MTTQYEKVCDCQNATASGPRIVMLQPEDAPGGWVFMTARVPMACDECDTPWRRTVYENEKNSAQGHASGIRSEAP